MIRNPHPFYKLDDKELNKVSGGIVTAKDANLYKKEPFNDKNDNNYLFQVGQSARLYNSRQIKDCKIISRRWCSSLEGIPTKKVWYDAYCVDCKGVSNTKVFFRNDFSKS